MPDMQKLEQRLHQLPDAQREALAGKLLEELEAALEAPTAAGEQDRPVEPVPDRAGVAETVDALRSFRKGLTLGDVTPRTLIEEGRV